MPKSKSSALSVEDFQTLAICLSGLGPAFKIADESGRMKPFRVMAETLVEEIGRIESERSKHNMNRSAA